MDGARFAHPLDRQARAETGGHGSRRYRCHSRSCSLRSRAARATAALLQAVRARLSARPLSGREQWLGLRPRGLPRMVCRAVPPSRAGRSVNRRQVGRAGWAVMDSLRGRDGVQIAAGHDSPVVEMDLVVASPAQRDEIVDVGGTALGAGPDVMGLADSGVLSAASASAVAGDQRVHLGLGGPGQRGAAPQRLALAVEHDSYDPGVAEVLLEHARGDRAAVGDLRERLVAVGVEVLNDGDVSRRLAAAAVGRTVDLGQRVQRVSETLGEAARFASGLLRSHRRSRSASLSSRVRSLAPATGSSSPRR